MSNTTRNIEINKVFEKLNIVPKKVDEYDKVTTYDYSQKNYLDINTYASI